MKIIVGSIGPTYRLVTLQHTSLESMTQVYFEQAHALWQGGVRVFYLDRCDDLQNAKAALIALAQFERETGAKVTKIVTAHVLENGRMLLGTSVMEIWAVLKDFNVQAFGVSGHFDAVELALMDVPDHLTVHLVALNFGG